MNSIIAAMSLLSVKSQEQSIINEEHTFMCEPSDRPFKRAKLSNNNDNLTDSILFATPFTGAFVGVFTGPFTGFAQHLPKFFSETSYDEENDNILFKITDCLSNVDEEEEEAAPARGGRGAATPPGGRGGRGGGRGGQ